MRIAVAGKGGAGKTTTAATLARVLARRGYRVTALDDDPNPNLAIALGLTARAAQCAQTGARRRRRRALRRAGIRRPAPHPAVRAGARASTGCAVRTTSGSS